MALGREGHRVNALSQFWECESAERQLAVADGIARGAVCQLRATWVGGVRPTTLGLTRGALRDKASGCQPLK